MSSSEAPPSDIFLTDPQHSSPIRELEARLMSDKSRRMISVAIIALIGVIVVAWIVAVVILGLNKVSTDPLERVLLPVITGLFGALGGLATNNSSR